MADAEPSSHSQVEELTSATELLRILECPVCTEVPLPPIFSCTRGHILCNICQARLNACVICKSPFSQARNFVMENIVTSSKFRCNYKDNGCGQVVKGDALLAHHQKCKFRNGPVKDRPVTRSTVHVLSQKIQPCYEWIPFDKTIPENAVAAGIEDGSRLYVIHAKHFSGAVVPGKLVQKKETALISWNGLDCHTREFEILVAAPDTLSWVSFEGEKLPEHAVIGGRDEIGGVLYVGRCGHKGTLTFGYVFGDQKYCWVSTKGTIYKHRNFEVLVKTPKGIEIDQCNAAY